MKSSFSKYIYRCAVAGIATLGLTSCNDWLGEPSPGSTKLEDFFVAGETCVQTINGCYNPLTYEYNNSYFSEWYLGDIASDDALKGGQNVADGADAYDIDNFKTNANNTILLDYYRAKYMGIARCNLALREVAKYPTDEEAFPEKLQTRLLGEAHFLRAFYYFQLVRVFGGVPIIEDVIDSSDRWKQPRATAEEVYDAIVADLEIAEQYLWAKSEYPEEDLGRATRGAARAMLCKVNLYRKNYDEAYKWGKKFVDEEYKKGEYSLCGNYADNFTLAGENGPESVFEIQYTADPTSDYGGFGFTRGTFSIILTRPRMSSLGANSGWGWNHPTQNLYDEFEEGDIRREAAIGVPSEEERFEEEVNYLGSYYYNNKTSYSEGGTFPAIDHHARGPLNYRLVRASDVLLLFAEAALEGGKSTADAKWALEEVRSRARANATSANALPAFPNYLGFKDDTESLRKAIRHERRVELAMEGHRWFDIVRWGIASSILNKDNGTYASHETEAARAEMAMFIEGKHELFPLPAEEIALNPMTQNPGY
ncbi:MAG: RagB/SusD family nutrient uptake outer membrane protein [Bacteroides sp.]|nr:RagB/SusD family nutrient uptake outer membrane protein [Bacteroides sp.]MBD5335843.1 RagB/SusD family nutrient uptake outer membrane protein [Bacteroides sp.]